MNVSQSDGPLIEDDPAFQSRMWTIQCYGRGVMAALIVVALLGLLGPGPLSSVTVPQIEKWLDGIPTIIVDNGTLLKDRMKKARVDESDILTAARELQCLERLDRIKYAILERSGGTSIIPKTDG